jgi:heme A synthase
MEFLTFTLIFCSAWILWRRPERERLAARLLVIGIVLMVFLFTLGTRTSLLPGLNY